MANNADKRTERDALGALEVPADAYYGIHTARAIENFALPAPSVNLRIVRELVQIKRCAAQANLACGRLSAEKANAITAACDAILSDTCAADFPISSLQGGAGTSTNMNVNECIANRASELLGGTRGADALVHPLDDVNLSQSTNDVYPTAVRIAAIGLVRMLSDALANLQETLQRKENEFAAIARLGRTQLMDALPMRAGQGFGAYAQAIARDRWRIYKTEERLRHINIGGTAIGTGLGAPQKYIFFITEMLQRATGFGLSRAESPMDITQNADVFAEVSGLLKACAVNLLKISSDLRLLASGPNGGIGEVNLPAMQPGSSIMPGKVNPVIPEMVGQVAIAVMANDHAISTACALGQLELNAFLPLIADRLLQSLELLTEGVRSFDEKCIAGITMNEENCARNLSHSTALAAVLIPHIGYDRAAELAKSAAAEGITLQEAAVDAGVLTQEEAERIFHLNNMTRPS